MTEIERLQDASRELLLAGYDIHQAKNENDPAQVALCEGAQNHLVNALIQIGTAINQINGNA